MNFWPETYIISASQFRVIHKIDQNKKICYLYVTLIRLLLLTANFWKHCHNFLTNRRTVIAKPISVLFPVSVLLVLCGYCQQCLALIMELRKNDQKGKEKLSFAQSTVECTCFSTSQVVKLYTNAKCIASCPNHIQNIQTEHIRPHLHFFPHIHISAMLHLSASSVVSNL